MTGKDARSGSTRATPAPGKIAVQATGRRVLRNIPSSKQGRCVPKVTEHAQPPSDPRHTISVTPEDAAKLPRVKADLSMEGVIANSALVGAFSSEQFPDYDLMQLSLAMRRQIEVSKAGDSSLADTLLVAQACTLNSVFTSLMQRAARNLGHNAEMVDLYMRLALKAQTQSRASLETLAKIKNPPNVAFVNQANIANGPQQVNNGAQPSPEPPRAEETKKAPIELLDVRYE